MSQGVNIDLPSIIPGGTFDLEFSEGVFIPNSINLYRGTLEGNIPAIYHLHPDNEDVRYWYHFGMGHTNPYLLRMLGKSTCAVDGKLLLFTEVVDQTLEDWTQENPLIDHLNRLTPAFRGILSDILRGMIYFHQTLNRAHGDIGRTNIYVFGGKAKLASVVNSTFKLSFAQDIKGFCNMVASLFKEKNLLIPFELHHLLSKLHKPNELFNSINHPVLLSPHQRGNYRHWPWTTLSDLKHINELDNEMNRTFNVVKKGVGRSRFAWIAKVTVEPYFSLLYYESPSSQSQGQSQSPQGQSSAHGQMPKPILTQKQPLQSQMGQVQPTSQGLMMPPLPTQPQLANDPSLPLVAQPKIKYRELPMDFLRFSRNVGEHIQIDEEEKDNYLNSIVPEFMGALHDLLALHSIRIRALPA